ncbi:MAG: ABC transporter permease subunit [Chitinophagaceae bacterium]
MWTICKKEWIHLFGSATGYLSIILYLIFNGLYVFIFPQSSVFENGYASLSVYFQIAPWVFLFLIPALCMRTFSEEFRSGTYEKLITLPFHYRDIVVGKFISCWVVSLLAIVCTISYIFTIVYLSANAQVDVGEMISSYIGLIFLTATFTAISIWASAMTTQPLIAFFLAGFICFLAYFGIRPLSYLSVFNGSVSYYIDQFGIMQHFENISRGVLDIRDVVYFSSILLVFLFFTIKKMATPT